MSSAAHTDFWRKIHHSFAGSQVDPTISGAKSLSSHSSDQSTLSSQTQALAVLDQVLSEVESRVVDQVSATPPTESFPAAVDTMGNMAQVVPQAINRATDTLNPAIVSPVVKEKFGESLSTDTTKTEMAGSSGPVEVEPIREMEMPVEVESYLQKVDNNPDQLPQEIVIADDGQIIRSKSFSKQPVIVLPMTEEELEKGKKKSPHFSVRWLVEWSEKIMKMFNGKVIYRQVEENA